LYSKTSETNKKTFSFYNTAFMMHVLTQGFLQHGYTNSPTSTLDPRILNKSRSEPWVIGMSPTPWFYITTTTITRP